MLMGILPTVACLSACPSFVPWSRSNRQLKPRQEYYENKSTKSFNLQKNIYRKTYYKQKREKKKRTVVIYKLFGDLDFCMDYIVYIYIYKKYMRVGCELMPASYLLYIYYICIYIYINLLFAFLLL